MKRIVRLILAVFAIVASPAAAQSPFGDTAAMDDAELAEARGGFILPGGLDLDFAIFQETSVDGELVLRSSYVLAETGPVVSVEQVSTLESVAIYQKLRRRLLCRNQYVLAAESVGVVTRHRWIPAN